MLSDPSRLRNRRLGKRIVPRRGFDSGERTRLACWRWRPRHRALSFPRSPRPFARSEKLVAARRHNHVRRVRSPASEPPPWRPSCDVSIGCSCGEGFGRVMGVQTFKPNRHMNVHHNARLTVRGRELIVRAVLAQQLSVRGAALQVGLSERSARKWLARFRAEGAAGLRDRSSRPHRSPRQTPPAQVAVVLALRRLRLPGFQISRPSACAKATVLRLLRRHGLARLSSLEPASPVVRYQRQFPGKLLHFAIKKLGKILHPSHRVTGDRRDSSRSAGSRICPCLHRRCFPPRFRSNHAR